MHQGKPSDSGRPAHKRGGLRSLGLGLAGWALLLSVSAHAVVLALLPAWQGRKSEAQPELQPKARLIQASFLVPPAPVPAVAQPARIDGPAAAPHPHVSDTRMPQARPAQPAPRPQLERTPAVLSTHHDAPVAVPAALPAAAPAQAQAAVNEAAQSAPPIPTSALGDGKGTQVAIAAQHSGALRHTDAKYLFNPKPDYPVAARKLGLEGTVTLRVLVNIEGVPEQSKVLASSGAEVLDEAALEAVRRWRFVPANDGRSAIAHWVDVPVTFKRGGQ